jgi:hypothetical protein
MDTLYAEMRQRILEQSEHYQQYMKTEALLKEVLDDCHHQIDAQNININELFNDLQIKEIKGLTLDRHHHMDNLFYYDMTFQTMVKDHPGFGETLLKNSEDVQVQKVLKALLRSRLIPFTIISRNNATGKVQCMNLLSRQHFYLTDARLGMFDASKEIYIGRVITLNNITLLTDYLLTFTKTKENIDLVYNHRKRFNDKYQGYISTLCFAYDRIHGIHPEEFKGLAYNM